MGMGGEVGRDFPRWAIAAGKVLVEIHSVIYFKKKIGDALVSGTNLTSIYKSTAWLHKG